MGLTNKKEDNDSKSEKSTIEIWIIGLILLFLFVHFPLSFYFNCSDYESFGAFLGLPGKTFWDFIELLVLPVLVVVLTYLFQKASEKKSKDFQEQMKEQSEDFQKKMQEQSESFQKYLLEQESNIHQEEFYKNLFNFYIKEVSQYLESKITGTLSDEDCLQLLQPYTYSIIKNIDSKRIVLIFDFLLRHGYLNESRQQWQFLNMKFTNLQSSFLHFSSIKFSNCEFENCTFENSTMDEIYFTNCTFTNCGFSHCTLNNFIFEHCIFFNNLKMWDAEIVGEILFNNCSGSSIIFTFSKGENLIINECKGMELNLEQTTLTNCKFIDYSKENFLGDTINNLTNPTFFTKGDKNAPGIRTAYLWG